MPHTHMAIHKFVKLRSTQIPWNILTPWFISWRSDNRSQRCKSSHFCNKPNFDNQQRCVNSTTNPHYNKTTTTAITITIAIPNANFTSWNRTSSSWFSINTKSPCRIFSTTYGKITKSALDPTHFHRVFELLSVANTICLYNHLISHINPLNYYSWMSSQHRECVHSLLVPHSHHLFW